MRLTTPALAAMRVVLISLTCVVTLPAQSVKSAPPVAVPRLITITGVFRPADRQPPDPVEVVTLAIYAEETGGLPLWQETQSISVDRAGRYTVLLGATEVEGIPLDVFASGEARWLGIAWQRPGEIEGPRTRLTSVPYALRASHADTLGGKPASAYLLAPTAEGEVTPARPGTTSASAITPAAVRPGVTNALAKYVNTADLDNSAVYETGGKVGINTSTPLDVIHARFTNTVGSMTGLAVQNLGNTATSYSGMLFYDHTGALGQFQGFNNVTHEYRINNVASNGSINFMLGGTSRFLVTAAGDVGIGTTTPAVPGTTTTARLAVVPPPGYRNAIFARKLVSGPHVRAIHARSAPGITGPLIAAFAGADDYNDYYPSGGVGVMGVTEEANSDAILAWNRTATGVAVHGIGGLWAGQFAGNVWISGVLTKGGGAFQIDHPLDPANKYLRHSFVESPDMMNVYNGNVTLDAQGEAWVTLPEWFEALNRDFRYQLTPVGAPGPNLYVAEEISVNRFKIAGGVANGKVSWQVTGIRQDAWANDNRVVVEEEKADNERGRYLHPEARGLSREMGLAQPVVVKTKEEP